MTLPWHSLIKRQFKRFGIDPQQADGPWRDFIQAVNEAYVQADEERSMLERSLDLSSQELLTVNSSMRAIFQAFPDLFFRLNPEGKIIDGKIGSSRNLYAPLQGLIGKRIQDIPLKVVAQRFDEGLIKLRDGESLVSFEYELDHAGNREFFEARMVALPQEDVAVFIRNISAVKELEHQLIQSEKMSTAGQLAGGVAHEINNPLATILATAQLALDEFPGEMDQLKEDLVVIEASTKRCKKIVSDLLGFSRSETLRIAPVVLEESLQAAFALVANEAVLNHVVLENKIEDKNIKVRASLIELQQVFVNLLLNSIQAMARGGIISVGLNEISKGRLNICFKDQGDGIEKEMLEKIFEPFVTTKSAGKGTGLGLSICRRLIEQFGGKIWAQSEGKGRGSVFFVSLERVVT